MSNIPNHDISYAAWSAMHDDKPKELQKLLDNGMDPNLKDITGYSLLKHSVNENSIECSRILLNSGAKVTQDVIDLAKRLSVCEQDDFVQLLEKHNLLANTF